jgi:hypothetical protein
MVLLYNIDFNYRMALDEITQEAKRGKERAETMGPMGWYDHDVVKIQGDNTR